MELPVHPLAAALAAVVDGVVTAVEDARRTPEGLGAAEATGLLLAVVAQAGRLTAAAAVLSTSVDDDGRWAADGARSFPHWLAAATGTTSFARARDLVATGRALRDHLPATRAAALAGGIGAEQAATLARLAPTTEARRAALAAPAEECGEQFLVTAAREMPADSFRRLVRRWASAADPEADERGYREACDREFVALSPTTGGFHLAGFLTTEHGALFGTALETVTTAPAPDDRRTAQQRRAQAVADLSRLVLDHGLAGTGAAVRPHLSVVVDFDTLRRAVEGDVDRANSDERRAGTDSGCPFRLAPVADVERLAVAEVLGAGPIPPSMLARLACDSEISRIVFGPDSQVINAGRTERTYSGPRRKAVIARDGTCRYPGCTAPPALAEIHHVDEWARDHGDTDVNTGVLLCWHHHDLVHRLRIEIRRSATGGFVFLTRHGTPVAVAV